MRSTGPNHEGIKLDTRNLARFEKDSYDDYMQNITSFHQILCVPWLVQVIYPTDFHKLAKNKIQAAIEYLNKND